MASISEDIIKKIDADNSVFLETKSWSALANKKNKIYYIIFNEGFWTFSKKEDITRFYKNKKSFAVRLSRLIRTGN